LQQITNARVHETSSIAAYHILMEPDIWFMAALMVGKHGADAPRIAEEILERLRREQAARIGALEESDIKSWLAIRGATVEWLDQSRGFDEAVH
jgi:hypothetical protein